MTIIDRQIAMKINKLLNEAISLIDQKENMKARDRYAPILKHSRQILNQIESLQMSAIDRSTRGITRKYFHVLLQRS
jgi:hypothetical protein